VSLVGPTVGFRARSARLLLTGSLVAVASVLIDQGSKAFARGYLPICEESHTSCGGSAAGPIALVRVENAGSVGGWAQGLELWTVVAALAVVALFLYGRSLPKPGLSLAWGLALGGAAGNLVDRVAFGGVTDFIRFAPFGTAVIVFNIADVALALGGIGLSTILYRGFALPRG
jgi:signal peptidase II